MDHEVPIDMQKSHRLATYREPHCRVLGAQLYKQNAIIIIIKLSHFLGLTLLQIKTADSYSFQTLKG